MSSNKPSEIDLVFAKAEQLRESGKKEEALQEYTRVVYFAPKHWPAYFHLGTLFGEGGKYELAVALFRRSAAINPENAVIKNHLADYLIKLNEVEEAKGLLEASWSLDSSPQNNSAPFKVGQILRELNRPAEAIEYFNLVFLNEDQDSSQEGIDRRCVTRWYRALCKLTLGEYQAAWADHEVRNNIPGVIVPILPGELWEGQSLDKKCIFFAYEQRFGDVIQFIRFMPRLKKQGAKVIVQIPPELDRQFRYSFPDIEFVLTSDAIPAYDYYQYIASVPAVLNLSKEDAVSDPVPYLSVDDSGRREPLPVRNETVLKVGFVWEGKPDPDRSIPLNKYIPLLKHDAVSFFSFQLGDQRQQLHDHAVGWLVHDLSAEISDFYDSSLMLKEMDLLITIDTAIVHQAGALGVPVWVMLRFYSDWRWELDRDDNDWYPTLRMFRQKKEGCWLEAGKQLESAFDEWVSNSLPRS